MPDANDLRSLKVEDLAERADVERDEDPRALYDAFRPVRELVEAGGPVPPKVYALMRTSQADVVACISLVRARSPWAFFAVGGVQRIAPRWVLLDGLEAPPIADLGRIAEMLRERLTTETLDHAIDDGADVVIRDMVNRLRTTERVLLPMRRQRALLLAEKVLKVWTDRAFKAGDMPRHRLLKRIGAMLAAAPEFQGMPTRVRPRTRGSTSCGPCGERFSPSAAGRDDCGASTTSTSHCATSTSPPR